MLRIEGRPSFKGEWLTASFLFSLLPINNSSNPFLLSIYTTIKFAANGVLFSKYPKIGIPHILVGRS
jgi:hypothetical protein